MAAPSHSRDAAPHPVLELVESGEDIAAAADRVAHEGARVVLVRDGQPIAELVPVSEETVRRLDLEDRQVLEDLIDQISARFDDVDPEVHDREVERAIAETRAEMRAEAESTRR